MDQKIKSKSKILYIVSGCIIVLMGIIYLGMINLKDTYSAEVCYCPEGYKDNGGNQCKSEKPIRTDTANCDNEAQCDNYRAKGYTCTTGGACTKVVYDYIAKTCVDTPEEKCYSCPDGEGGYTLVWKADQGLCNLTNKSEAECKNNPTYACYKLNNKYYWLNVSSEDADNGIPVTSATSQAVCESLNVVTLTFINDGKVVKTESCTISNSGRCTDSIIAPGPQEREDGTGVFNGWGEERECKTGSYTANASFMPTVSKTYYACYTDDKDETPDSDFSTSKCTYSDLFTVTRDQRYLNCKYTNITYNNSATEDSAGNVRACCAAKGYVWVSENFTSSGYGYEYCIVCGGDSSGGGSSTNPSNPSSSTPGSSTPGSSTPNSSNPSSSNVDKNPQTGSVAIFIVWVIALGMLVYSFIYFKQSKFE